MWSEPDGRHNGYQSTSISIVAACAAVGARQAFTSFGNPIGNTEHFLPTLEEEPVWPRKWPSPAPLVAELEAWIAAYNTGHLHSVFGYRSLEVLEAEQLGHTDPLFHAC